MREKWKKLLAACGILVFVILLTVACSSVKTNEGKESGPETQNLAKKNECAGCHEMKPEVLTWQLSSHNKLACTTCHNVKPSDFQAKHDTQSFAKPIKISEAVPNSICEQCHSENRVTSATGDLIIPHNKHTTAGVACVKCHSGVVHAKIAERGLTAGGELSKYEAWDLDAAKKAATMYYIQPSMWTCIDCHKQLKVTRRCGACHTTIPTLPSHDKPTWKTEHGKTARTSIGECTKCHVTPDQPKFVTPSTGDQAADFARAQEFCYKCHLQRPEMHEKSMLPIHPEKVAKRGRQNCLTCHDQKQPEPGAKVTGTYCNQCHWLEKRQ